MWRPSMFPAALAIVLASSSMAAGFSWQELKDVVLTPPGEIILREALTSRWVALSLADSTLERGTLPRGHDAVAFISARAIAGALDLLEGTEYVYATEDGLLAGATVTLERLDLVPSVGQLTASVSIRAATKNGATRIALTGEALVRPVGISPGHGDRPAHLKVRVEPTRIQPSVDIGFFSFAVKSFWATLAPDLVRLFARPELLTVEVPFADRAALNIGFDETRTERVNDDGATITYRTHLPESTVEQRFSGWPPVISPAGIWIAARRSEQGQTEVTPPPPPSGEALRTAVAALEAKVASRLPQPPAGDVEMFISGQAIVGLAQKIGALPTAKRTIVVETSASGGRLANVKWRDKVLGEGGAYAELADPKGGRASLEIGVAGALWNADGLSAALTGRLRASAPVHVHVDPLIGGGAGTTVGVEARSDAEIGISARLRTVESDGHRFVVLDATPRCQTLTAVVASDGKLKLDFGWIAVPKIGARMEVPIGRDRLPPSVLFDTRPHFVPVALPDPDGPRGPWKVRPAWGGATVRMSNVEGTTDANGLRARASLVIEPGGRNAEPEATRAAEDAAARAAQALTAIWDRVSDKLEDEETGCAAKSTIEILLGDIAIGPNNEIVKFLTNAWNDLTKGPGPGNELVKIGAKMGEVLRALAPQNEAARKLTHEIAQASAKLLGADNPVTKTFTSLNHEMEKLRQNPPQAVMDAPRNAAREAAQAAGNIAREGGRAIDNTRREAERTFRRVFR